jgi:hypothetical protein
MPKTISPAPVATGNGAKVSSELSGSSLSPNSKNYKGAFSTQPVTARCSRAACPRLWQRQVGKGNMTMTLKNMWIVNTEIAEDNSLLLCGLIKEVIGDKYLLVQDLIGDDLMNAHTLYSLDLLCSEKHANNIYVFKTKFEMDSCMSGDDEEDEAKRDRAHAH